MAFMIYQWLMIPIPAQNSGNPMHQPDTPSARPPDVVWDTIRSTTPMLAVSKVFYTRRTFGRGIGSLEGFVDFFTFEIIRQLTHLPSELASPTSLLVHIPPQNPKCWILVAATCACTNERFYRRCALEQSFHNTHCGFSIRTRFWIWRNTEGTLCYGANC